MNPPPAGWPRISQSIIYVDPLAAIDWLVRAFGFEVKLKVVGDDGQLHHSELVLGGGLIMVAGERRAGHTEETGWKSPQSIGGVNTQMMMVYVDDVDAFAAHATANGARLTMPLKTTDYGDGYWTDRACELTDLEGHHWYFTQRVK